MKRAATRLKRFWHGLSLGVRIVILTIVALLVVARLLMPWGVERYVNKKLQQLPGYGGSIGEVDVHLWRGAYTIHNVNITKKTNNVAIPFVAARSVDFSVQWRELKNHALVAEVELDRAQLNFVRGKRKEEDQTHIDKSWVQVVQDLFPFKINRFEIRDSTVRYADLGAKPKVDVAVTNLHVVCRNITNSRSLTNELPTPFEVTGGTIGGGRLRVHGAANPLAKSPRFDVDASLEGVDLTALNDFLRAYAKVDVKGGRLDFFTEMAAADGRFKGYVKPLLENLDIIDLKQDIKHPLKLFWESFVAGVVKVFKNHPKDQVAAKVPIEGSIDNPKAGIVETLASVLRNAFIRALTPHVDETIDLQKVKPDPNSRVTPQRDTKKNEKPGQEKVREKVEESRSR
jgi:hypothetical protein